MLTLTTKIILMPIIGFIIGYFTNYIAIKMLFHPRNKILGIQGVIPKRKSQLARNISHISPELMPSEFKKIEKIPFIGTRIIEAFKHSIEKRINSLSDKELEEIVLKVVRKELSFVTWVGGVLGFLIGLLQALILLL